MEAITAMLAAASIGAIWSSTSPEFGATVDHLSLLLLEPSQCRPLVFLALRYPLASDALSSCYHL